MEYLYAMSGGKLSPLVCLLYSHYCIHTSDMNAWGFFSTRKFSATPAWCPVT